MTAESRTWIDKASDRELALLLHFVVGFTTADKQTHSLHTVIDNRIKELMACQQK